MLREACDTSSDADNFSRNDSAVSELFKSNLIEVSNSPARLRHSKVKGWSQLGMI